MCLASLLALERLAGLADGHAHGHAARGHAAHRLVHRAALVQLALDVHQPPQHEPEEERGAADQRVALLLGRRRVRVGIKARLRLRRRLRLGERGMRATCRNMSCLASQLTANSMGERIPRSRPMCVSPSIVYLRAVHGTTRGKGRSLCWPRPVADCRPVDGGAPEVEDVERERAPHCVLDPRHLGERLHRFHEKAAHLVGRQRRNQLRRTVWHAWAGGHARWLLAYPLIAASATRQNCEEHLDEE